MIVVKVELHSAITGQIKLLGTMVIDNIGGTTRLGDYRVSVGHRRHGHSPSRVLASPARKGRVSQYPRLSSNVWQLVSRAILSAFPEERE